MLCSGKEASVAVQVHFQLASLRYNTNYIPNQIVIQAKKCEASEEADVMGLLYSIVGPIAALVFAG